MSPTRRYGLLVAALLLIAAGCGPEQLGETRAQIRLMGTELDFGSVRVGQQATLEIGIRNDGTADLAIEGIEIVGDANPEWFSASPARLQLSPGASGTTRVSFAPLDEGEADAILRIASNDPDAGWREVTLAGIGYIPSVEVSPKALDFGTLVVDSQRTLEVQLHNAGHQPVVATVRELSGGGASQYRVETADAGADLRVPLDPGETDTVSLTYAPSISGTHWASVFIEPCDGCASNLVSLSGRAIDSGLVVTPVSLDFGMTWPGLTVPGQATFRNVGDIPIEITALDIEDGDGEGAPVAAFSVQGPALPAALAPEEELTIEVSFSPPGFGQHEALLAWASTDRLAEEGHIVLQGHGGAACQLSIRPDTLAFGLVERNIPRTRTVVLKNEGGGDAPCFIDSVSLTDDGGGAFQLVDGVLDGATLERGEQRSIEISFQPDRYGSFSGTAEVSIGSDSDMPRRTLALSGASAQSNVLIAPGRVDFGKLPVSCPAQHQQVCIHNVGTTRLDLMAIDLSLGTDEAFGLHGLPAELGTTPVPLSPGDRVCFDVSFEASEPGVQVGEVTIEMAQLAHDFVVVLEGSGSLDDTVTEVFEQPVHSMVDVLFVVEGSTWRDPQWLSMTGDDFFQLAQQLGVDYQLGVTYRNGADASGGGLLRPLDLEKPRIFEPGTPSVQTAFMEALIGTDPSDHPRTYLWAAEKALHPIFLNDPQRNLGFVRPEAHLSIVFISPYYDWGGGDASDHHCGLVDATRQGCGDPDYYWAAYARVKDFRPDRLSVHGIRWGGSCGNDPPLHTDEYWLPFHALIERTGGHCVTVLEVPIPWEDYLTELAPPAFGYRTRFVLAHRPVADSIEVEIVSATGEVIVTPGWTYDPEANAIAFEPVDVPPPGARVEVTYVPLCGD